MKDKRTGYDQRSYEERQEAAVREEWRIKLLADPLFINYYLAGICPLWTDESRWAKFMDEITDRHVDRSRAKVKPV